jgi:acyl-CoA dehydrogenase
MGFREEIRAWLEEACPPAMRTPPRSEADDVWGGRRAVFATPEARLWLERMAQRGLTAPTWPREAGGAGLGDEEARILAEELRRLGCRPPLKSLGLWMLGPVLLRFGSEAQKREHLPSIARGEIRWCQGYSEPGAGSDLASVATRAARESDVYVVNGQKIWTSHADLADWMFCLVRTDPRAPRHEGLSFLLIDMESPGIRARPIRLISGASPFCETFFDDVRVPAENLVGREGQGWEIAKALLAEERRAMSRLRDERTDEEEPLQALASRYGVTGDAILEDRIARAELDRLAVKLTLRRYADEGRTAGPEASVLKVTATEASKRARELRVAIAGFKGLGWEGEGFSDDELALARDYLRSRALSIEGGTTEIQLNIIAKRVLGLPD